MEYTPLEAFLISIQNDYDTMGVNNVGIKYMADTKDMVTANTIRKTMSKLRKYGQLEDGVARLDEDENMKCMSRVIIRTDERMSRGRKYVPSSVHSLLDSYRIPCFGT